MRVHLQHLPTHLVSHKENDKWHFKSPNSPNINQRRKPGSKVVFFPSVMEQAHRTHAVFCVGEYLLPFHFLQNLLMISQRTQGEGKISEHLGLQHPKNLVTIQILLRFHFCFCQELFPYCLVLLFSVSIQNNELVMKLSYMYTIIFFCNRSRRLLARSDSLEMRQYSTNLSSSPPPLLPETAQLIVLQTIFEHDSQPTFWLFYGKRNSFQSFVCSQSAKLLEASFG